MAVLIGVFVWSVANAPESQSSALYIPLIPGILAGATFAAVLVSYFAMPTYRLSQSTAVNYFLCLVTLTALVVLTKGVSSPYLSLFILTLSFAGALGSAAFAISLFAIICVFWHQFVIANLSEAQLLPSALVIIVASVTGLVLWLRIATAKSDTVEDKSYHELASQLSQVAGTSEVVINAIDDGVMALDSSGNIKLINPAAQRLTGWGDQDAIGLNYGVVLRLVNDRTDSINENDNPIARALTDNKAVKDDSLSIKTQSGKSFLAGISISPVGALGNGVIVVFRDITSERSDERQRAEFISTASHEMRTPVASIEGYLGLALNPQTATIDARALSYINKAHESAQHLGRLFADLLDISKADDHRLKNNPQVVDVIPFIGNIVDGLTLNGVEKGLKIFYKPLQEKEGEEGSKRLSPIFYANVDNDHLREIVQNLVENAIKYTPSGSVTVDVGGDSDRITISIADTGIGIPVEDQAHLFQKFYRVDNSDTREIGGTGLGLYLCRRLAETIGGRLWVESEYKKGSTFFLSIPRLEHAEAQRLIESSATNAPVNNLPEPAVETPALSISPEPQPASPPSAPQQKTIPQTPAPNAAPPPQSAPSQPQPQPQPQTYVNTPIYEIEANPEKYAQQLRQQTSLSVPPRDTPRQP